MGSRYSRPETTTITISQGDTLLVHKRLTHGQRSAAIDRQYEPGPDGTLHLKPGQIKLSLVTAFLIDWSITDFNGERVVILHEPIDVVEAALNGLLSDDFDEIHAAILKHDKAMAAERAKEKKQKASRVAAPTSPSLSDVAGVSSGSVS